MKMLRNLFAALAISAATLSPVVANAAVKQESVAAEHISAKPVSGGVELSVVGDSPVAFELYSITGQRVKSLTLSDASVMVELPKGVYIVKTNHWAKQVVVK